MRPLVPCLTVTLATFLFAGCLEPPETGTVAEGEPPSAGFGVRSTVDWGHINVVVAARAGVRTLPAEVGHAVAGNETMMLVELAWVGATPLRLVLKDPSGGETSFPASTDEMPVSPLRVWLQAPAIGRWEAIPVDHAGLAVEVDYRIALSSFTGSVPESFTALTDDEAVGWDGTRGISSGSGRASRPPPPP